MRFDSSSSEQWKPVRGYEGLYEVSNMGRVRALFRAGNFHKPGRILKPWVLRSGYVQVHLMRPKGKRESFCIHRLVLDAFVGPAPEKCEARHLNCNRADNSPENLAWGTHKENYQDSIRMGTIRRGESAGPAKLTNAAVLKIRELWEQGVPTRKIAADFGIDRTNVWQIRTRKTWSHL